MEKYDISSQRQDQIRLTQNQFDLNQLSQQVSCPQQFQNQESSYNNIQNELENTNITTISEQTLLKKVKSQIIKRSLAQDRIFQNAIYQVINQKGDQHAIISQRNQENENYNEHISSKNPKILEQDKNSLQDDFSQKQGQTKQKQTTIIQRVPDNQINLIQLKRFEQITDSDLQKDEKENSQEQTLNHDQTNYLENINQYKNSERKIFEQDKKCPQNNFIPKKAQIQQQQIVIESVPNNQINCRQPKYLDEKNSVNLQKNEQEHEKEYTLNKEQTNYQGNDNEQQNSDKKDNQQDNNYSTNDFSKKQDQIKQSQNTRELISNNKISTAQIKETLQKNDKNLQNDYQQHINVQTLYDQQHINVQTLYDKQIQNLVNVNFQKNTDNDRNQFQTDDKYQIIQESDQILQKDILNLEISYKQQGQTYKEEVCKSCSQTISTVQQKIQSTTSGQSDQDIKKYVEKENNSSQNYSTQLEIIFDEIMAYSFQEYENPFELEQKRFYKKIWEEEIFDRVNQSDTQSDQFKSLKQKIYESLKIKQLYLCKILYTNQLEDLILGFYLDNSDNFDEYIFKIIYNPIQSDINLQIQIIQTLGFQFELIKLEEENILILGFQKNDYLSFSNEFEQLAQFSSNIKQIEYNNYEINTISCQKCSNCQDQNTCQNINCFKNIKCRITSFLKYVNKYQYCEYQNKLIEGVIFQLNQDQLITEYLYFVHKIVFSFLKNNQIGQQNEIIYEKKLSCSQEELIKYKIYNLFINEYSFQEYSVQTKSDQNQEKGNISNNFQRQWDINKFIALNQTETSAIFQKLQMEIIQMLQIKKYFLCKCFVSNESEDIFIGYQEEIQEIQRDYIFVIKYNPIHQEISKYFLLNQFNEELNYFVINNFAHIFILSKDAFLQINCNFEYLSQNKIEWTKDYFENINRGKEINLKKCYQCDGCKKKKECLNYINFTKFQKQKNTIFEKLIQKSYYICEYLTKGGEGLVFQGFRQSVKHKKQDFVFKILFGFSQDELENEIQIMKMFDCHVNVIKFIDLIQINNETSILILEKCQFSLMDELKQLKLKQEFSLNKLLQMIFNLLDGLIQFRIYNILHLDIKPSNILLNYSGQYVYTDFGMSSLKKQNKQVQIKGWTNYYAPHEQLNNDLNIDYQSDVFSLGKTIGVILKYFQDVQLQNHKEIVSELKKKVDELMVQNQPKNRLNCLDLRNQFYNYILTQKECIYFLESYVDQIIKILESYPYDKNKEIPYFLQISLFYQLNILDFRKEFIKYNQQNDIQQIQLNIAASLNNVGSCYENLGDNKKALECQLESLQMRKQIFKENHRSISTSLNNVGGCYQNLGDNKKALEYQLESLQITKQIFKENHPDIAASLNNIGSCYKNLGDNKKALEYQLESLQMRKQIFKENHHDIAASLNNVGSCYQNLGDNKKALEYQLESLQMRKQIFKENHPDIATSLNNVGTCYIYLGDNKKALEYQKESLQMRKQIFKENHPSIATSLNNVGNCYKNLGDNKKALEYQLESLQMRKQIFKENHPDIATSLNNVGTCYQILGDNKKALEYQLESLQMRKQIFKENHPQIATSLNNVGLCYKNLGDNKKALEYQLESLQIRKQIFKENHPSIATSLNNVGNCYKKLGHNKKALEYQLESLQMRKQIFKENHPDIATSLNNVGTCYIYLGDNNKALEYQLESLQIRKQIFKENHPSIATSLNNVGLSYENLGDNQNALEYLLESLQMRKQIFKENHPDIATSLNNVGLCYQNLDDNKKALEYQLESLQMRIQIYKKNHPLIARSLNIVGNCYQNLGDNKKALEYQLESLQMRKQIFKENHPDIATSLNNVGTCYIYLGDNKKALEYQLESLQMRKQIFKENHPQIATSLNNVGLCYKILGDNKKALEYQLECLQMRKYIFKENHPDIAASLNNVGSCYENLRDNKKALECQLESLQMRQQIFKENHPLIATSLNNVGNCFIYLGDNKKALEYQLESLQMRKQIFKENHPDIATSLNNVGTCYQILGDNKKALKYQLKSLQMRKQIFKENHPSIAKSLNNVGNCYQNLGDNKKALEYQLKSLQMRKQIFKENHPSIAKSLNNVGLCYKNIGNNKKALEYQLESLQMFQQIFKENHPDIAGSLNNVGLCYIYLGDNKMALEYQLESLQINPKNQ